ncbi:CoA-binding protein [Chitinilyticum piscinae]|uniref:CoA-binding protein n=1 Tax=Chitinilyticum piscinae TaxID=2866724 RepID=A0A8J7FMD7_9NEIS|nr:CoA-binding protein [Chitinilyticum piscinae]MBE9608879.1 CoA-binding protein [Chitinilyticum piscinae]
MSFANPGDDEIRTLLEHTRRIAVVGISDKPGRASHGVSKLMQRWGFTIIPVNPLLDEVLGEKCYPNLLAIPEPVDLVNVFRRPAEVDAIVDDALAIGAPALWLQLDVINEAAAQRAQDAGMTVIMDRCLMVDYGRLCSE